MAAIIWTGAASLWEKKNCTSGASDSSQSTCKFNGESIKWHLNCPQNQKRSECDIKPNAPSHIAIISWNEKGNDPTPSFEILLPKREFKYNDIAPFLYFFAGQLPAGDTMYMQPGSGGDGDGSRSSHLTPPPTYA